MNLLRKLLRPISWLLAGTWSLFVFIWLIPYVRGQHVPAAEVEAYSSYLAAKWHAQKEFKPPYQRMKIRRIGAESLTPLTIVEYEYSIEATKDGKALSVAQDGGRPKLRYDRLIGSLLVLFILAVLGFLPREQQDQQLDGGSKASEDLLKSSLKEALLQEINRCQAQCRNISKRSTIMLWIGALIASGGLGVLYFLFPWGARPDEEPLLLARAFTVVLYVEAIAFLLLRQYRLAQDDYAYFNGLRNRNVHYLYLLLAIETKDPDVKSWFTATLPTEDPHQGRPRSSPAPGKDKASGSSAESGTEAREADALRDAVETVLKGLKGSTKGS